MSHCPQVVLYQARTVDITCYPNSRCYLTFFLFCFLWGPIHHTTALDVTTTNCDSSCGYSSICHRSWTFRRNDVLLSSPVAQFHVPISQYQPTILYIVTLFFIDLIKRVAADILVLLEILLVLAQPHAHSGSLYTYRSSFFSCCLDYLVELIVLFSCCALCSWKRWSLLAIYIGTRSLETSLRVTHGYRNIIATKATEMQRQDEFWFPAFW